MLDELCRILNNNNAIADASSTWIKYVPKIISQAQRENGAWITSSLIVTEDDSKFYDLDGTCIVIVSFSEQSSLSPAIPSTNQTRFLPSLM